MCVCVGEGLLGWVSPHPPSITHTLPYIILHIYIYTLRECFLPSCPYGDRHWFLTHPPTCTHSLLVFGKPFSLYSALCGKRVEGVLLVMSREAILAISVSLLIGSYDKLLFMKPVFFFFSPMDYSLELHQDRWN